MVRPEVLAGLDRVADRGHHGILRDARRRIASQAGLRALRLFPAASLLALAAAALGFAPAIVLALGCGLPVLLPAAMAAFSLARVRSGRGAALARIDGELALKGRMQAADAFLSHQAGNAFTAAAVADAADRLAEAERATLAPHRDSLRALPRDLWLAFAGGVLLVAALVLSTGSGSGELASSGGRPATPLAAAAQALGLDWRNQGDEAGGVDEGASGASARGGDVPRSDQGGHGAAAMAGHGAAGSSAQG
ncbi:hypothetical protein D2V17_06205, partial [Aurantiacibacter xanthus]